MRCALYARYSSDHQSERSIDDQLRLCRERLTALGGQLVETFTDYAISGASAINRPGLQAMMAAARAGRFEAVVAEALDRISRDQEDVAAIYKRLTHLGIKVITAAEGEVNELHVGLKGTMNALFLKDLAAKIRRGQSGRAAEGLSAGGLPYGYAVDLAYDAKGEPIRGRRRIVEDQANVVRRIFRAYAAGETTRAIAAALNREGIPGPRSRAWNASTIAGSRKRRSGILHNEMYLGRIVFNRQTFRKDPDTGRRVTRANPAEAWVVADRPDLRIIDDAIWAACQAKMAQHARIGTQVRRRARHLLDGLTFCGSCGGAYSGKDRHRISCINHRERGTCDNGRTIARAKLEAKVLTGLREQLVAPEIVAEALKEYRAERRRLRQTQESRRGKIEAELREVVQKIDRIVAAIEDGVDTPTLRARLPELEARRADLERDRAAQPPAEIVDIHPGFAEHYRQRLDGMVALLDGDGEAKNEAIGFLRALIERITLHPGEGRGELRIAMTGQLAGVFELGRRKAEQRENARERKMGVIVGSGGGIQPVTPLPLTVWL